MATIIAKLNPLDSIWNPLDPNNWIGGVVPGPDDIARFYTYTTNTTYETGYYYTNKNRGYDNSAVYDRNQFHTAIAFGNGQGEGFYTRSFWEQEYSRDFYTRNWSGSFDPTASFAGAGYNWIRGDSYAYGSPGTFNSNNSSIYTYYGDYYAQGGYNYKGSYKSMNLTYDNSWNYSYGSPRTDTPSYGPTYYRFKCYVFRVENLSSTSLTIDGVTISETDTTTYATKNRAFGVTKAAHAAANPGSEVLTDRITDLFTGSALHIDNGGKWQIWGPHNGRQPYYNNRTYLNSNDCFTIAMYTSSDSYSPSVSDTNLYTANYSTTLAGKYHIGLFTASAAGINDSLSKIDFPLTVMGNGEPGVYETEGTSSFRFSTRFGNEVTARTASYTNINNQNDPNGGWTYSQYTTSSHGSSAFLEGSLPSYDSWQGVGPGNLGRIRWKHDGTFNYDKFLIHPAEDYNPHKPGSKPGLRQGQGLRIDPTFSTWTTSSKITHPIFSKQPYSWLENGNITGSESIGGYGGTTRMYKQGQIQYWELTGSQEWNVGRIEMGRFSHFHVKDNAHIVLHDMQGDSNGTSTSQAPTIDFEDHGLKSTLYITDESTIEISSSRTAYWNNDEAGIYLRRSGTSLIISGAANYSSSKLTEDVSAGSSTLSIDNLSDTFAPGDIISVQSTASFKLTFPGSREHSLDYVDQNDPTTWYSGSYEEMYHKSSGGRNTSYYNGTTLPPAHKDSVVTAFSNFEKPSGMEFDNPVHTDEITVIASTSSNTATIRKFFGKEGEIHHDMGLYNKQEFADTFPSGGTPIFTGNKRVVLVDSNHKKFTSGDQLEISGSVYTVLHNITYLSQSLFVDFSRNDNPSLDDMFYMRHEAFSGSSIWPIDTNADGDINTSTEDETHFERVHKNKLLITGSYQSSRAMFEKYGRLGVPLLRASGSNNGYRALQIDPTLSWYWESGRNYSYDNLNNDSYNYRYRYYVNNNYTTWYGSAHYLLKNTDNFEFGEITISGSLLRNGFMDPTSSIGYWNENSFGVTWGNTVYEGSPMATWDNYGYQGRPGYNRPYPYSSGYSIHNRYYGMLNRTGQIYDQGTHLSSKSDQMQSLSPNPGQPYRYSNRGYGKTIEDDPASGDWSIDGWMNDFTASYYKVTQSIEDKRLEFPDKFGGSGTLRVTIDDNTALAYVGDGRGNELLLQGHYSKQGRGPVGLQLNRYGSIHSVNIKERYQQLILDTTDSFSKRDKIYESRLLYNHDTSKEVNFIGTLVTDAKGHKNLLWEYMRTNGNTDILPYMFGACSQGTTAAGTTSTNKNTGGYYNHIYGSNYNALIPKNNVGTSYFSRYQANDNFYVIYDFGTQVTFDTIGMIFNKDTYGSEHVTNNQMNNVEFQVCDDVGVASPAWEIVRAKENDLRYSNYRGGIRFYTFASGSVNKRYIRYHSRGGTNSTAFAMHSHFGVYNFSGSCADSNTLDASSVAGGFADQFGSPTASMCQIELASTKNWKTGDMIYFWSKQMNSSGVFYDEQYNSISYYNTNNITGWQAGTTPEAQILNGKWPIYTITNIQGNIVTLDRPVTQMFIDAGTIAYKYNRGKVTLKAPRQMIFNLGFFYNHSVRRTMRNITGINAVPHNYSATYQGMYSIEDAGIMPFQGNVNADAWYLPHGLYRNIYTSFIYPQVGHQRWDQFRAKKCFNYHTDYSQATDGILGNLSVNRPNEVISFCKAPNQYSYNTNIYGGWEYGQFSARGHVYYQNNWAKSDRYSGIVPRRITPRWGTNDDHLIHIGDLVTVDNYQAGIGGWWDNSRNTGYSNKIYNTNNNTRDYNLIQYFTWWNPYATNPKTNPSHLRHSGYSEFPTTNNGSYFDKDDVPILYRKNKQSLFPGRDMIAAKMHYYGITHIVPTNTHADDKMYELHVAPNQEFSMTYSTGTTFLSLPFKAEFTVMEDADVRLDISMIYKMMASQVYAYGETYAISSLYNNFGNSMPCIFVENLTTQEMIYNEPIYKMDSSLNLQEILSLPAGHYRVAFRVSSVYRSANPGLVMFFKDLKFKLVTTNKNNIVVIHNNWDMLKLLEQPGRGENYSNVNNLPYTENTGPNSVVRQANNLTDTKTIKFNKIKL